jgi:hypothetical protein
MATQPPGDLQAVRLCRARNTLLALVRDMLAGSGLDIRDRDKYLVIRTQGPRPRPHLHQLHDR